MCYFSDAAYKCILTSCDEKFFSMEKAKEHVVTMHPDWENATSRGGGRSVAVLSLPSSFPQSRPDHFADQSDVEALHSPSQVEEDDCQSLPSPSQVEEDDSQSLPSPSQEETSNFSKAKHII